LFSERDHFTHHAAGTEIITQFVKGTTETSRGFNCSKAAHGILSLFNPTVVLFQPIIEIRISPMLYVAAHRLAYGPWIGRMTIRRYLIGNMTNHCNSLLEKLLGCLHIPFLAQHGIHQIAIVVDSPIEVAPLPMHFEVRFIDIPGFTSLSTSSGP
jgi:hypothetical protein